MESKSDSDNEIDDNKNIYSKDKENNNERDEKFEFLKVVKERENFPCKFNKCIQLKKLINYYDKNWSGDLSDDDEENDGDDDSDKAKKIINDSSSSSDEKPRKKKGSDNSSSD